MKLFRGSNESIPSPLQGEGYLQLQTSSGRINSLVMNWKRNNYRAQLPWLCTDRRYKSSTAFLAHGVRRRKFKLDLILGSLVKQRILILLPKPGQPYCSTKRVSTASRVMPCRGLCCCGSFMRGPDALRSGRYSNLTCSESNLPSTYAEGKVQAARQAGDL